MRNWISTLTLNQNLAVVALVLGAVAVVASPYAGGRVTLDARELALAVGTEADHIDAPELAAWIVEGRADYRLIDLRGETEYAEYHIPGAVHIPIAGLMDGGLGRTEKLVFYSDGGIHAVQAWLLLKAQGFRGVYVLKGGLEEWKEQVLFPVVADNPTADERARDERRRSMAAFFGGQPRSASAIAAGGAALPAMASAPSLSKVAPPASPAGAGKPVVKKKKKEGC